MTSSDTISLREDELLKLLQERRNLRNNLTTTQGRCGELLNETRDLRKENARLRSALDEIQRAEGAKEKVNFERDDLLPNLADPVDPFDNDLVVDGGGRAWRESESFITLLTPVEAKANEDIKHELSLSVSSLTGSSVSEPITALDWAQVSMTGSLIGAPPSPFHSPHKQPPFTPRRPGLKDIVVGGRSWRNRTRVD